jgi:hypothetical protein
MNLRNRSASLGTRVLVRLLLVATVAVLLAFSAWLKGDLAVASILCALALLVCGRYATARLLGLDANFLTDTVEKDAPRSTKLTLDAIVLLFSLASLYGLLLH